VRLALLVDLQQMKRVDFSFDGIPPGSYEITVYSLYHFPASVSVSVGETALSEVVLYTTKSILGCLPTSTSFGEFGRLNFKRNWRVLN
jgi:hypothetical protein